MIWHAIKLIWNRRSDNALIILELVLAFLVVFFITAFIAHTRHLYKQPLGYTWEDTVELRFSTGGDWSEEDGATLKRILQTVRDRPEVEFAHVIYMPLFRNSRWVGPTAHNGLEARTMFNQMTDGAPEDLGIELLDGRWFNEGDHGLDYDVMLINERLRDALFADGESPLGVNIRKPPNTPSDEPRREYRVIGVYRDFRQYGEMAELFNYAIGRFPIEEGTEPASAMTVRLRPDTPVDFEQILQETVQGVAKTWNITITPLDRLRDRQIREVVIPLTIGGLISGFLVLMVAFGLFGVLWQNVTRRTDELGLRRAVGASRRRIYRQIIQETAVLATLGALIGGVIAVQFPLTGSFDPLTWRSSTIGLVLAGGLIIGMSSLCSLYPAWLAARLAPAEALHYE